MWHPSPEHPLRRLFSGLTEHTFMTALGVADPPLTDYLSGMLSRFIAMNAIFRLHDAAGRRLEEVAEMMIEAEAMPPEGRTRRELHRHIGDFTLFWTGVYPEALKKLRSVLTKDSFIDYCAGKTILPHRQHVRGRALSRRGTRTPSPQRRL